MNTQETEHSKMVADLAKPGQDIIDQLTPEKAHLWHMASALAGEAGELFDAVKRQVIYNKEIDRKNVIEELGDMEFYMEGVRQGLGITREETLEHNLNKLLKGDRARYKKGKYSDQEAQDRSDKQEDAA